MTMALLAAVAGVAGAHSTDTKEIQYQNCTYGTLSVWLEPVNYTKSATHAFDGCSGARVRIEYGYQGQTYTTSPSTSTTLNPYGGYAVSQSLLGNAHPVSPIYDFYRAQGKLGSAAAWSSWRNNLYT